MLNEQQMSRLRWSIVFVDRMQRTESSWIGWLVLMVAHVYFSPKGFRNWKWVTLTASRHWHDKTHHHHGEVTVIISTPNKTFSWFPLPLCTRKRSPNLVTFSTDDHRRSLWELHRITYLFRLLSQMHHRVKWIDRKCHP